MRINSRKFHAANDGPAAPGEPLVAACDAARVAGVPTGLGEPQRVYKKDHVAAHDDTAALAVYAVVYRLIFSDFASIERGRRAAGEGPRYSR